MGLASIQSVTTLLYILILLVLIIVLTHFLEEHFTVYVYHRTLNSRASFQSSFIPEIATHTSPECSKNTMIWRILTPLYICKEWGDCENWSNY